MSELPEGWVVATLRDLVGPEGMFTDGDWILSKHLKTGKDVRLIQLADVGTGRFLDKSRKFISDHTAGELRVTYLRKDDVLISRMADPLARACRFPKIDQPAITAVDVAIARCDGNVALPAYLMHLCNSHRVLLLAESVAVGTTRKRISRKNLEQIRVPLAPLAEQQRIVKKLEELFGKVDSSRKRLERVPVLLERFRQAVLAAACSGRLTADWREENPRVEDAAALLRDVEVQRIARYQAERDAAKSRGQKAPALNLATGNPDFSEYDLPELPSTWEWSHVSKFGFVKGGKRLPKGESLVEENTRHPYLRIRDLRNGTVDRSGILYVPRHVFPEIRNYTIQSGDVYLTIVGSIGEAGTIPPDLDGANLTENAAKVVQPIGILSDFLAAWFRSPACQRIIQQNIHSGGQGKLALFRIEGIPVPIAPLAEQHEVVRRIEALLLLADKIKARCSKAKAQVDRLTQSLLARAFRGELVPTEAEFARREGRDYEDAASLLKRIAAIGETTGPFPRRPRSQGRRRAVRARRR